MPATPSGPEVILTLKDSGCPTPPTKLFTTFDGSLLLATRCRDVETRPLRRLFTRSSGGVYRACGSIHQSNCVVKFRTVSESVKAWLSMSRGSRNHLVRRTDSKGFKVISAGMCEAVNHASFVTRTTPCRPMPVPNDPQTPTERKTSCSLRLGLPARKLTASPCALANKLGKARQCRY